MLVIPSNAAFPSDMEVTLNLEHPWTVVHQAPDYTIIQHSAAPTSFRIQWHPQETMTPGVSPWLPTGAHLPEGIPIVAWPFDGLPIHQVDIETQGPDLVVRFFGPPINSISNHPDSPDDPILLWTRIRYRGDNWRLIAKGLSIVHLPGEHFEARLDRGEEWRLTTQDMGRVCRGGAIFFHCSA